MLKLYQVKVLLMLAEFQKMTLEEATFEGYGPGGVGMLIQVVTTNGSITTSGSISANGSGTVTLTAANGDRLALADHGTFEIVMGASGPCR